MTDRKPSPVRRTEIADAVLDIVADQGIAALSTRVLAAAVGVTPGALFKHYPSREALLLGAAERAAELLAATFPEASLPPLDRLRALASARLALVAGRAGVLRLVLSEQFALALPPDAVQVLRAAVLDTRRFAATALRDGQRAGTVRGDLPADALALLFLGALQVSAMARRVDGLATDPTAVDVFLQAVRQADA